MNNPNIARPGSEGLSGLKWMPYYKAHRLYVRPSADRTHFEFDLSWRAPVGELFFSDDEIRFAANLPDSCVIIEPNPPIGKRWASNKDWGYARYQRVADLLSAQGYRVAQLQNERSYRLLERVTLIKTASFRQAAAALKKAPLYIGPEGGLHHAAAAVNTKAVVIFGGFISPVTTGYDMHSNLYVGGKPCGKFLPCNHCRQALDSFSVDQVYSEAVCQLTR